MRRTAATTTERESKFFTVINKSSLNTTKKKDERKSPFKMTMKSEIPALSKLMTSANYLSDRLNSKLGRRRERNEHVKMTQSMFHNKLCH